MRLLHSLLLRSIICDDDDDGGDDDDSPFDESISPIRSPSADCDRCAAVEGGKILIDSAPIFILPGLPLPRNIKKNYFNLANIKARPPFTLP